MHTDNMPTRTSLWAVAMLGALLVAEVLGWIASDSDSARAAIVCAVMALLLLPAVLRLSLRKPVWIPRLTPTYATIALSFALIGFYALVVALFRGNDRYYIAADLYHWYIELLLMAAVTLWVLGHAQPVGVARTIALYGLIVGLLGLAVVALGSVGLSTRGGHYVRSLGVLRLIIGRGTPQLLLIVVTTALWYSRYWDRATRLLLLAAWLLLLLCLAATLKRTLWISFPIAAAVAILPRRILLLVGIALLFWVPMLAVMGFVFPDLLADLLHQAANLLTYNPSFTIEETLARRGTQLQSVWPYVLDNPLGYGFGAEIYAFWTRGQTYAEVHYIHNLYAYYVLQLGIAPVVILAMLALWLAQTFFDVYDQPTAWSFCARAGLGCLIALALNGASLVPTHTIFAGFAIGVGVLGAVKCRAVRTEKAKSTAVRGAQLPAPAAAPAPECSA
jgi:hypothetical protein